MTRRSWTLLFACVALWLSVTAPASAATIGQIDTFEDGTTQGWVVNLLGLGSHPAPPANVLGGPGGADDNFLKLTSVGGTGAGSRLVTINFMNQWAGDYIAAGIKGIRMDVNNIGASDLALRLEFEDPTVGPPTNIAFSTNAIVVPSGSGWQSVVFPVTPGSLTAGLGSVEDALRNATALRIYHSPIATFPGNPVTPVPTLEAMLGVDNIEARDAVPAPAAAALFAFGMAAVGWHRRRRR